MDLITWCLLGLVILVSSLALVFANRASAGHKLPPGPRGLPLIGCPWAMFKEFHLLFTDMAKTWGEITCINIMGKTIVSLNSADAVREAFTSPALGDTFSGRNLIPIVNEWVPYMTGFIQPDALWSKQRKVVHKILNHYESLQQTERTVREELTHVINVLETSGESVNMDEVIYNSLINIITILLKGQRYDYDSRVLTNVRVMDETGGRGSAPSLTILFAMIPVLKRIPIGPGKLTVQNAKAAKQFNADYFEDGKATYESHVTRGMIDFLLHHQEESRLETGSTWLQDKIIEATLQEMVGAGVITQRAALYSFFLIIAHHPVVATNIQNEIEAVVGGSRFPKLEDRSDMPYTMAAMFELFRYTSHVPVGLPRETTDDVTLRGHFIPKHATVYYNSWCFHHDEKTWPEPWTFKPERFLDSDGKLLPVDHPVRKNLIPFGIGRRSCAGEAFAKSRIFLFITTLLQRFDFAPDPTRPSQSCDPRTYRAGIILAPFPYWLRVTSRG